jgi:hypothetical protein
MPGEGRIAGDKSGMVWTDYLLVGGSEVLQTAGSIILLNGSGATADITTGKLNAAGNISGAAVTYTKQLVIAGSAQSNSYGLANANIGSPASWASIIIQAGSDSTGTGSNAWTSFPLAYSATPSVVVSPAETAESFKVPLGSINVGSFYVATVTASQDFTWISVGIR